MIFGTRGLDFNTGTDDFSYGGDIYRDEEDRPFDTGVEVGQGIETNNFNGNIQAGYLINPASNLKIFADVTVRNFNPEAITPSAINNNTVWFNFGIRTDLFNWYFDFQNTLYFLAYFFNFKTIAQNAFIEYLCTRNPQSVK